MQTCSWLYTTTQSCVRTDRADEREVVHTDDLGVRLGVCSEQLHLQYSKPNFKRDFYVHLLSKITSPILLEISYCSVARHPNKLRLRRWYFLSFPHDAGFVFLMYT